VNVPKGLTFVVMLAAGALLTCCASPQQVATEDTTVWRPLGVWSGSGLTQTEAFISDTGLLRLQWEARERESASTVMLRIAVHSAVSGRSLVTAVDRRGPGSDVAYVTEDPRSFYLVIESTGLDWSVNVAEGVPATRRAAPASAR
jgi:hypothetical protein